MTLREFIANLEVVTNADPRTLDLLVVTSSDSEGNSFSPVSYLPTLGIYESNEFSADLSDSVNAICVN